MILASGNWITKIRNKYTLIVQSLIVTTLFKSIKYSIYVLNPQTWNFAELRSSPV